MGKTIMTKIDFDLVSIEKPAEINFILGQTHFIKTVEDIYETIIQTVPNAQSGVAFCEASGPCKIRSESLLFELSGFSVMPWFLQLL